MPVWRQTLAAFALLKLPPVSCPVVDFFFSDSFGKRRRRRRKKWVAWNSCSSLSVSSSSSSCSSQKMADRPGDFVIMHLPRLVASKQPSVVVVLWRWWRRLWQRQRLGISLAPASLFEIEMGFRKCRIRFPGKVQPTEEEEGGGTSRLLCLFFCFVFASLLLVVKLGACSCFNYWPSKERVSFDPRSINSSWATGVLQS